MIKRIRVTMIAIALLFACSAVVFAAGDDLEILPSDGFSIGDVDMDKDINIKDATLIQKYVAVLAELSDNQRILADADFDSEVTIKDATYIQKHVAKLVGPPVPAITEINTTVAASSYDTVTTEEGTTAEAVTVPTEVMTEATGALTDPTEATKATLPVTEPTQTTATDPTEATKETTAATNPVTTVTDPEETVVEPTTRDKNKPIELPFVPAK